MIEVEPITLTGQYVRLEPLRMEHAGELYEAIRKDPDLWKYMFVRQPRSLAEMEHLVGIVLRNQQAGDCLPFVIIDRVQGCAVGETRYLSLALRDHGLEIGSTWLTPAAQRTAINSECKYLLLRHAFEEIGAIRVQLKTHHLNTRSQQAIERLGAVKEGILRNHIIMPDGSYRHSVYYSIIESEWPEVKARLEARLACS